MAVDERSLDDRVGTVLAAYRERSGSRRDISGENHAIAREILDTEAGLHGERDRQFPYALDDRARDILLAHGRQEVAHALLNSVSILSEVAALRRQVRILTAFLGLLAVAGLGIMVLLVWTLGLVR